MSSRISVVFIDYFLPDFPKINFKSQTFTLCILICFFLREHVYHFVGNSTKVSKIVQYLRKIQIGFVVCSCCYRRFLPLDDLKLTLHHFHLPVFKLFINAFKIYYLTFCVSTEHLNGTTEMGIVVVSCCLCRHQSNGAVIARCGQPEVSWWGWRNADDEHLVQSVAKACASDSRSSGSRLSTRNSSRDFPNAGDLSDVEFGKMLPRPMAAIFIVSCENFFLKWPSPCKT